MRGRTAGTRLGIRLALLALAGATPLVAQAHEEAAHGERAAVERAALDYLEGFYEGDEAKLRRGISPDVVKYGYFVPRDASTYTGEPMSFQQMLDYAERVNSTGRTAPADAPKEVEILDLLDQTAAVKVTAFWGSDYLQLAKVDGRWKILHVLWQSPPRG
ncbi:MAG: nuclear transport factor 2 family protein [Gemmatimonadota bacterium]